MARRGMLSGVVGLTGVPRRPYASGHPTTGASAEPRNYPVALVSGDRRKVLRWLLGVDRASLKAIAAGVFPGDPKGYRRVRLAMRRLDRDQWVSRVGSGVYCAGPRSVRLTVAMLDAVPELDWYRDGFHGRMLRHNADLAVQIRLGLSVRREPSKASQGALKESVPRGMASGRNFGEWAGGGAAER